MSVDQIFDTLDSALPLLFWPGVEWTGHPERMPICFPGFCAAAHGLRQVDNHVVLLARLAVDESLVKKV